MMIEMLPDILFVVTALLGLAYAVFISRAYLRFRERSQELEISLRERMFESDYSQLRLDIERQIADLNRRLVGSQSDFEKINHLAIDAQSKRFSQGTQPIDAASFIDSLGINENQLKIDQKKVFVLTPFHPSEKRTFATIADAFTRFGLSVVRGDETPMKGDIRTHVSREMLSARLVIANANGRNPNVMYELGIAHALGKDVIIISNSKDELPFDINSRRILFYSDGQDLKNRLTEEVIRVVFSKNMDSDQ